MSWPNVIKIVVKKKALNSLFPIIEERPSMGQSSSVLCFLARWSSPSTLYQARSIHRLTSIKSLSSTNPQQSVGSPVDQLGAIRTLQSTNHQTSISFQRPIICYQNRLIVPLEALVGFSLTNQRTSVAETRGRKHWTSFFVFHNIASIVYHQRARISVRMT